MQKTISKKLTPSQIEALYEKLKPLSTRETRPQYTLWQIKTSEDVITAYQSGKVVFQGPDLFWVEDLSGDPSNKKSSLAKGSSKKTSEAPLTHAASDTIPQAGSDEVGTGDFFGPIVVVAALVPAQKTADRLHELGITDSKAMTDERILQVYPELKTLVPYASRIMPNTLYNKIWNAETMNINRIKARMHNQAWLDLKEKVGGKLPELCMVDQFCKPATYYGHLKGVDQIERSLQFETKAESRYIAVAAASVLARAIFLENWKKMEEHYGIHMEKGAGPKTDKSARTIFQEKGMDIFPKIAKMHFRNGNPYRKRNT